MEKTVKRIATRGIADEMRDMNVGDVVQFPLDKYKFTSVRSTPHTTLVDDRVKYNKRWRTRVNYDDKCVEAVRMA